MRLGDIKKAKELLAESLSTYERLTGKDSLPTASSLHNLAMVYKVLKRPKVAIELLTRVLKVQEMLLPDNHPDYARTLYNMATLQAMSVSPSSYTDVMAVFQTALEARVIAHGKVSLEVANTLNNMASLHLRMDNAPGAMEVLEESIALKELILGPDHPGLVTSLINQAKLNTFLHSAKWGSKEDKTITLVSGQLQRARLIASKVLGEGHSLTGSIDELVGSIKSELDIAAELLDADDEA